MTEIITRKISRRQYRQNIEWLNKNPDGWVRAFYHPRNENIILLRGVGREDIVGSGIEVEYPLWRRKYTQTFGLAPESEITIELDWIE